MTIVSIAIIVLSLLQFKVPELSALIPPLLSWSSNGNEERLALRSVEMPSHAPVRIQNDSLGVVLTARSAIMTDVKTGAVLWEKNPDEVRQIASITKLASMLVVSDLFKDMPEIITISKDQYSAFGFNNFAIGEEVKTEDLAAAVIISSDNTAIASLARATALSEAEFVKRMNEKVGSLGLTSTRFADSTGLSNDNVSTAREVLVLAKSAFADPLIARYAGKRTWTFTSTSGTNHVIKTTDKLIGGMLTVVAAKTGYVTESGYNIVAEVTDKGAHAVRGVVLGSATNDDRFQDFKMLAYWTWHNFTWQE